MSLFTTVEQNVKAIEVIQETLAYHTEQMEEMKSNAIKLESAVTYENRETRALVTQQVDKLYGLVEQAMGFKKESASREHELKMLRWNTMSAVFLRVAGSLAALASSGGIIYYLIVEAPK